MKGLVFCRWGPELAARKSEGIGDGGGFRPPARDDLEGTMKKNNTAALAAAAMALAVTPGPARSADVPRVSYVGAAAPYRTYNWIGPYIGVNAGYQWGSATNSGGGPPAGPPAGAPAAATNAASRVPSLGAGRS